MILFDATPIQSEHRLRGVGTYTRHLAVELTKRAPDRIQFAATSQDMALLPDDVRGHSVTSWRPHRPAQVYWMYNAWYLRRMMRLARPALFHATDFNGLLISKGIPTIATLYDVTSLKEGLHHQGLSQRMSDWRWQVYYRRLAQATHIIAISEAVRRDAIEFLQIPPERITAIPLGVDPFRFAPKHHTPAKNPYLLFMGGRNPNKNVERILRAFAQVVPSFPNFKLYIGGTWSQADKLWLEHMSAGLGIKEKIRHLGFIEDSELPSMYQKATAFLFPSIEEGFGLPVLEAMSARTVVITSHRGALSEVAGDAAILVDPLDVADIARGIWNVIENDCLRIELIRKGTERVRSFSWSAVAEKTLAIYERFQSA